MQLHGTLNVAGFFPSPSLTKMFFLNILSLLVFAIATTSAATIPKQRNTSGFISPTAGTIVAPGGQFDFKWDTMADYGLSSYNFTVFLFTQAPTSMAPSEFFGSGYYLGRFSEPNYPGQLLLKRFEVGLLS